MTKFEARCVEIEKMKDEGRMGEALVAACDLLGGAPADKLKKLIKHVNAIEEIEGELHFTAGVYRDDLRARLIDVAVNKLPRDAFNLFYYAINGE